MHLPIASRKARKGIAATNRAASLLTGFVEAAGILGGQPMLYLCAGNPLEYDARHASVPGCNDLAANILNKFNCASHHPIRAKENHVENPQAFPSVSRQF